LLGDVPVLVRRGENIVSVVVCVHLRGAYTAYGGVGNPRRPAQEVVTVARDEAVGVSLREQESLPEVVRVGGGDVLGSRQDARLRQIRGLIGRGVTGVGDSPQRVRRGETI